MKMTAEKKEKIAKNVESYRLSQKEPKLKYLYNLERKDYYKLMRKGYDIHQFTLEENGKFMAVVSWSPPPKSEPPTGDGQDYHNSARPPRRTW